MEIINNGRKLYWNKYLKLSRMLGIQKSRQYATTLFIILNNDFWYGFLFMKSQTHFNVHSLPKY